MPDVVLNTKHPGIESLNAIRYWSDDKFALKEDKTEGPFIIRLSFEPEFIGQPWVLTGGTERYTGTVKSTPDDITVNGIDDNSNPIVYTFTTNTIEGIEIKTFFKFKQYEQYYPFGIYALHITTDTTPPYAADNLIIYYDAINNTGTGHSSLATTWKDLSGNSNDGIIKSGTWENNALIFNGSSTFVNCWRRNFTNVSVEVYLEYGIVPSNEVDIASNFQDGGYGLSAKDSKTFFIVHINGSYTRLYCTKNIVVGEPVHIIGTYDGIDVKLFINGVLNSIVNTPGTITRNNTIFALGGDPNGESVTGRWFKGKIKSFRLYDRALTEDEVYNNYIYELKRYS